MNVQKIYNLNILSVQKETPKQDPCLPNPCGPYSVCKVVNGVGVCSCQPNYVGAPPACKPECIISANCPLDLACINMHCKDPCPGTCGVNARCAVVNHNPICSCTAGYTGDPFIRCVQEERKVTIWKNWRFNHNSFYSTYRATKAKPMRSITLWP